MRKVFADTGYWIALLNPYDDLHDRALAVSQSLGPVLIVTTEMVLVEMLNYYARRGDAKRKAAVELAYQLQQNPNVSVTPQTSKQFATGLRSYEQRPDKKWSHTDCCSFLVMESMGMSEALTYDQHFEQAGFVALLR